MDVVDRIPVAVVRVAAQYLPGDDPALERAVGGVRDVGEVDRVRDVDLNLEGQVVGDRGERGLELSAVVAGVADAHAGRRDGHLDPDREREVVRVADLCLAVETPSLGDQDPELAGAGDEVVLVVHASGDLETPLVGPHAMRARPEEEDVQLVARMLRDDIELTSIPEHVCGDGDADAPRVALDPVPRRLQVGIEDDHIARLAEPERPRRTVRHAGASLGLARPHVLGGVVNEDLLLTPRAHRELLLLSAPLGCLAESRALKPDS